MGDIKDMVYRLRIKQQHRASSAPKCFSPFFGKAVVVISRIDHNGPSVKYRLCGRRRCSPPIRARRQHWVLRRSSRCSKLSRLKISLPVKRFHPAHCFSLKFRCLFRHDRTSFLCCDAHIACGRKLLFIFVVLDLIQNPACSRYVLPSLQCNANFTRCAHCSVTGQQFLVLQVLLMENRCANAADTTTLARYFCPSSGRKNMDLGITNQGKGI